jgi:hypothetical protein
MHVLKIRFESMVEKQLCPPKVTFSCMHSFFFCCMLMYICTCTYIHFSKPLESYYHAEFTPKYFNVNILRTKTLSYINPIPSPYARYLKLIQQDYLLWNLHS